MDFISAKETAIRWGLSVRRINALANSGRIPGAQRVGHSWMIPADAKKPDDGRYKEQRQTGKQYHFPLFIYAPFQEQSFLQGLSEDELRLLEAQLACESCDFDKSLEIMNELVNNTQQFYVKIGALYYLCSMAPILNLPDLFHSSHAQLRDILATDFPHWEDFQTIMLDIDALYLGNNAFLEHFSLDNTPDYSQDILPYLGIQSTYHDSLRSIIDRTPLSTNMLSLICKNYEQTHLYIAAQVLHLYTAFAFTGQKSSFVSHFHLRRAIELGIEHHSYRILAVFYSSVRPTFDDVLKDYDPTIGELIKKWSKAFDSNVIDFIGASATGIKLIAGLNEQQIQLMTFATQGLTNKEVALFTGIPEHTVRRRYETLFQNFGISNKKQLAALFIKALTDGYK